MEDNTVGWDWDKPEEEGLYLYCDGDVEALNSIRPLRIADGVGGGEWYCGFQCYTPEEISVWPSSYKYARLYIGG